MSSQKRSSRKCLCALLLASTMAALAGAGPATGQSRGAAPPSPEELRQLVERMIANTHRNDAALEVYERVEHWTERKNENDSQVRDDKTYRVVPTGTGTLKLILKEYGKPVDPEFYRKELRQLEQVLVWALDPEEAKQKARVEKWRKRSAERFQTIEAFRDAYEITWLGRETHDGRGLIKLLFDPKPGYRGQSVGTDLLSNSRVTLWLDGDAQVVRIEAQLVRDMLFGGGLLGKLNKGGHVAIDQMEVR